VVRARLPLVVVVDLVHRLVHSRQVLQDDWRVCGLVGQAWIAMLGRERYFGISLSLHLIILSWMQR